MMRTEVNAEVRQMADISDLIFGVDALVSCVSRFMTLFPGDLIHTGAPAGVALFMQPRRFVKYDGHVRCEIEDWGAIENVARAE